LNPAARKHSVAIFHSGAIAHRHILRGPQRWGLGQCHYRTMTWRSLTLNEVQEPGAMARVSRAGAGESHGKGAD